METIANRAYSSSAVSISGYLTLNASIETLITAAAGTVRRWRAISDVISRAPAQFEVREIELSDEVILRRRAPLVLEVREIEADGCLVADVPGLGNSVAGYSLAEVENACLDLIAVLWEEYARTGDEAMTERARALKAHLIETYVEEGA